MDFLARKRTKAEPHCMRKEKNPQSTLFGSACLCRCKSNQKGSHQDCTYPQTYPRKAYGLPMQLTCLRLLCYTFIWKQNMTARYPHVYKLSVSMLILFCSQRVYRHTSFYCVFYKSKVCVNPEISKCIGSFFQEHLLLSYLIFITLSIFQTFVTAICDQ